jgi:beta-1,2-mannobiose phosphorylase / 1,2-beta-oligomannan phosphorylase
MLKIKKEGILISKTNLEFENEGVLNPAAIREGENIHLFYRAVRKGNFSSIGYCKLDGPLKVSERSPKPFIVSQFDYESHGVEDARVVKIDDLYFMTYTAYDGINARGALATSKDLKHFKKYGTIVPYISYDEFVNLTKSAAKINKKYLNHHILYYMEENLDKNSILWDKDVIFFPKRIHNKLVFLHRIRPGIQIAYINDLKELTNEYWKNYCRNFHEHILMDPQYKHESGYIGGGCPPIETKQGWLLIYHGVEKTKKRVVYSACAALLDLNNPSKVIARLPYALFSPEYEWEQYGEVDNVVFPTGTSLFNDTLYIYYGAADEHIACASVSISALLKELLTNIRKHEK